MQKDIRLSKVSIHRVIGDIDYASDEALLESLNTIRVAWNVPIAGYVRDLIEGRVDAISFTRDEPFYYFSARRMTDSLSVTIKDASRVIDFSVPLRDAEKMLIA